MKQALFYTKKENNKVQCNLCPNNCLIPENKIGSCRARKNIKGVLYSLVYGKPASINIDPIEKKPLYHFLPGTQVLSFGTFGCNLHCLFCQNWEISQAMNEDIEILEPKRIVELAKEYKTPSIAYTYTEPAIFFEYVLETAKLAKKEKIKNVMVSNGYINEKPLKELIKYIDAFNIDLKAFDEDFYKKICFGKLKPILETLKLIKKYKKHLEITNLIIPTKNDNLKEIEKMCVWISKNLGKDTPLHFSRFFPCYKLTNLEPTPIETLVKAKEIAKKYLKYVYIGNVPASFE
ncbi:MAG: AmmeMemoRadiSam system radical SAM enzyme [Candidatus Nanoarchaeia archaeon]|nr:AmmeMemoRadiSam system radical SAM enzyme [Candidatus Nanoarchaeia archaeon]